MSPDERRRITFRQEQRRAVATGVLETAIHTFLVLIAVAYFQAGATAKALVVVSPALGHLLSPLLLAFVKRGGWRVSAATAVVLVVSGTAMLVAAAVPTLGVFVAGCMVAFAGMTAVVPLSTQMYQDNYPSHLRGSLFSKSAMIRIAVAAGFAWLGGRLLSDDIERFSWLLAAFGLALLYSALCMWRCPSQPPRHEVGQHPLHAMSLIKTDAAFRLTLISWMFMGFGNLVMMPLRVEYLANPDYGIALPPATVALLTGVLPSLSRLLMTRVWGFLFDRMNFFVLRIVLNVGFMSGILAFFMGQSMTGLVIGALIFGVSMAGGDIAWSLWVTKIAPPDRVADYMSVHTFFTGVRGVAAPFLAFHLIRVMPVSWLVGGCLTLILVGSVILIPEAKTLHRRRAGQPLVPRGEAEG